MTNTTNGIEQPRSMFSAATFFDVIDSGRSGRPVRPGEPQEAAKGPAVVAFYGFKGGAGRTMALAHVAMLLADRGLRVGALDFDLEAPGLHVALGAPEPTDERKGVVSLLHEVMALGSGQTVPVLDHVQVLPAKEGLGKVLLMPAGKISRRYLAQIEELGSNLWHAAALSPLDRLLDGLRPEVDVILVDCRTGFNGMSASILFHHADVAVILFPLSEQVWSGVDVLLKAAASARTNRDGRPGLLFVPSMVPPGSSGQAMTERYLAKLGEAYDRVLGRAAGDPEDDDAEEAIPPWLDVGICWDNRLSTEGGVRLPFQPGGPWGLFQPLRDRLVALLDLKVTGSPEVNPPPPEILHELTIHPSTAFAEDLPEKAMQGILVPSQSVKAAVDRNTALIVGAKGAGKTLLWRYLVREKGDPLVPLPEHTEYVVGHAPKPDLDPQRMTLSADAFKELEKDAAMQKASTHKAFWLAYALVRLGRRDPAIHEWLGRALPVPLRATWRKKPPAPELLMSILGAKNVSTLLEGLFADLDDWLAQRPTQLVLVYDGLDTGFQTGTTGSWYERRERFVTGLLQVVADWRTRLRRIQFKVFLREDIYLSLGLQNQSHLDSTKHDLRFVSIDLWQLALKIACTSQAFVNLHPILRQKADGLFMADEEGLKALLHPFWGRTIEKGKQAYSANYILKRTSDAQGRLFPRTFVQMLHEAIEVEKRSKPVQGELDRVLRFKSLQEGVRAASKKRTDDLLTEYVELKPYLNALSGAPTVATGKKLKQYMSGEIGKPAIPLHLGPGGWDKVLGRLVTIGVFARQQDADGGEERYTAALMYRAGLELKGAGLS
jgi:MinD-like ATPase involved in chromosome partitioning or flagellar assembly